MFKKIIIAGFCFLLFSGITLAQKSGGSRSSGGFSGGGRSSYSSSSSRSSYSSSSSTRTSSGSGYKPSSSSAPKTNTSSFDSSASRASKLASGAAAYQATKPPSPTVQKKISSYSSSSSKPRAERERVVYRSVPTTTVIYHDSYHPSFSGWLLQQSPSIMAMWMYNHRAEMDEARYRDLMASNAEVRTKLAMMEAQRIKADPTYSPPGIDYDVMYAQPVSTGSNFGVVLGCIVIVLIVVVIVAVVIANTES